MALVSVPTGTYEVFKAATLGNYYDIDGVFGAQCVDLGKLLWGNIGYPLPYLKTGPEGYAYEIWTVSREWNAGTDFTLIYNLSDVKKGDMIIIGPTSVNGGAGHNAFADEDYTGGNTMLLLGQNQVDPSPTVGHATTLTRLNVSAFLGAFRYKVWDGSSPEPSDPGYPVTRAKGDFPWFIYARKRRGGF